MEKLINVPLEKKIAEALEKDADKDGRATCRQAQRIITEHYNRK